MGRKPPPDFTLKHRFEFEEQRWCEGCSRLLGALTFSCSLSFRVERLKVVLDVKEEALRKLKQDLRSQQQGEESCKSAILDLP